MRSCRKRVQIYIFCAIAFCYTVLSNTKFFLGVFWQLYIEYFNSIKAMCSHLHSFKHFYLILTIYETLTGIIIPSQSGSESNSIESVFHTLQKWSFTIRCSLVSYLETLFCGAESYPSARDTVREFYSPIRIFYILEHHLYVDSEIFSIISISGKSKIIYLRMKWFL